MELQKRQLPQIKIFGIKEWELANKYVIECWNNNGNEPQISHSGDYISVICNKLVETNYIAPKRTIPVFDIEKDVKNKWWQ